MRNVILILLYFFSSIALFAQTATGNIENYIGDIIDNAPGSTGDNYIVPNTSELNKWNAIIDFIMVENLIEARSNADELNYQVTEFTDTSITPNQVFYILEEKNTQINYWGTYVFSKTPTRNNLIIQAPHIKYDTNTGKQAIYCFKNNVARAVFINGTHRCNSDSYSSCSGTTSACGSSDNYKMSDLAHTTTSMFQKTTENMFKSISNSVFVQLHGFGKRVSDPYVIMSNGTRETPAKDYAVLIKEALLVEDNTLTFKLAHKDLNWTRLIGFTNTQGRLINGSPDYCNTSATSTSGRFIHIEQEKYKLRNDETGWNKMSNALSNVFSSTLGLNKFEINNSITISPNPSYGIIKIKGASIDNIQIFNILGQELIVVNNRNNKEIIIVDLHKSKQGIYYIRINLKNKISITRKIIRL